MRDEVIRIILEAKDKLSNVVRSAERNVNNSLGNMRNDLRTYDRDSERYSKNFRRRLADEEGSIKIWSKTLEDRLRRVQNQFNKFRNDASKPIDFGKTVQAPAGFPGGKGGQFINAEEAKAIEKEARRQQKLLERELQRRQAIETIRRRAAPFRAFSEGVKESLKIGSEIKERIAGTKEEIKLKKEQIKRELQDRRDALAILDANDREALARQLRAKEINAQRLNREAREQFDREQDERDKRVAARTEKIRKRNDEEEAKRQKELNETLYLRARSTDQEIYKRQQQAKRDIRAIEDSTLLTKRQQKDLIDARRFALKEEIAGLRQARKEDANARKENNIQINRDNLAARQRDIKKLEDANARVRTANSKEVDEENRKRLATARAEAEEARNALSTSLRQSRRGLEQSFKQKLAGIGKPGQEADLLRELRKAREEEQAFRKDTDKVAYAMHGLGNAWGDVVRGFQRGRSAIRDADKTASAADNAFAKLGQTVGRFTKNIGNLVNLRWYLVISAIQILGQLVLVLAANLISLASSAAIAASALGAGFVAAIGQALPVVGLFAASLSRVRAAFTAAQQATKIGAQSSQDARAQADAQTAAQQRLTDALYAQKQAVQQLADARRQARRDIVDSINAEIDANFALKDAEFAVLDAKQRLRELEQQNKQDNQAVKDAQAQVKEAKERLAVAKKEGDQAEISNAQQQLAIAQQNLSDAQGQAVTQKDRKRQVDEQKLAVKEAQQQLKEARISQRRQEEDTARTVRLGVKGNQAVVDALHGVAQANREVANAQRGVTEASKKQASAGNLLQRQLSQLDPAERGLYKAFRRIHDTFKRIFRPITDIIVRAVTGAVDRFNQVLQNPKVGKAFRSLSLAIGKGITDLSKYFSSKSFIGSFVQFIHEATRNIPILIKIIENLAGAFIGVAKAGEPVVRDILGRFANLTGRFNRSVNAPAGEVTHGGHGAGIRTSQQTRGEQFVSGAQKYLDSWIKLAGAVGRVFKYLILDAAPTGNNLVGAITRVLNNFANFLRDNPQKVSRFFQGMFRDLKALSSVLFPLVKILLSAFTGSNATTFTKFTAEVVLPGIAAMIKFLGLLAKFALVLSHIPGIKLFLQFLVFEKTLNKIFPATQRVTDAVKKSIGWFFKAGEDGSRGFTKLWRAMQFAAFRIKYYAVLARDQLLLIGKGAKAAFDTVVAASKRAIVALYNLIVQGFKAVVTFITETLIPALVAMGEAMYASLGPWGLVAIAVAAVITAIVLLLRHFHLLKPVLNFVEGLFKDFWNLLEDIFNWVKSNWGKMLQWLVYPFKQAYLGIKAAFNTIKGLISDVVGWVKDHWKLLAEILVAVFIPGGILLVAIYKFKDKIIGAFKDIKDFIVKIFKDVVGWLKDHFQVHVKIKYALGVFPYPSITFGKQNDNGSDSPAINPKTGPVAPIAPIPGFNQPPKRRQQFADGGLIRGADGQAVHIVAHAGEWVLNKVQQAKLARKLNESTQQVSAYLFGTNKGQGKPSQGRKHGGKTTKSFPYNLVSQTDDNGNVVWFIELDDGSYAGVTHRDAMKIQRTKGGFIPKYIKRDTHGFTQAGQRALQKAAQAKKKINAHPIFGIGGRFAMGGIVGGNYMPSYQMGGVVSSPQSYAPTNISTETSRAHHKRIEQNFNVNTQGETDWNYVMRLAAMHAQESF